MVVDLKRFAPGKELEAGLLWVAEQIPGLVLAADLTDMLALSYWPSFNVPYFPEIYRCAQNLEPFRYRLNGDLRWTGVVIRRNSCP